ncbi:hypothetical protein AVEN_181184-1 [Araneus ventricosus]|uniref:Uncharacterized protein n=1 Tax=Araneus ventricosus TaxID=182803 RepID=A0A4Y2PI30_ARAVE|nr:hypothetical protein AVEN_181184-1 [Araneus ventricosus]
MNEFLDKERSKHFLTNCNNSRRVPWDIQQRSSHPLSFVGVVLIHASYADEGVVGAIFVSAPYEPELVVDGDARRISPRTAQRRTGNPSESERDLNQVVKSP